MLRRSLVVLTVCLAMVLTAETSWSGDKGEQQKLEGTWSLVKLTGGKSPEKVKDAKMTFKGDTLTMKVGDKTEIVKYSVDPKKKPKEMNLHIEKNGKKVTLQGIYELDGDALTICHFDSESTEGRPKQLEANDKTILAVLKRDKN